MFGYASQPSRIYSYGAKPPLELQTVEDQMRAAHKYRNVLVELEIRRRAIVDLTLREMSPRLLEVESEITKTEETLEGARLSLSREQARERKKVRPDSLTVPIMAARVVLRALRAERKLLRIDLFSSPEWTTRQAKIEETANLNQKQARAESGLYWGTYLHVEQSMAGTRTGAPPTFKRFDGGGHLAIQLQRGLSITDLFAQSDTRLQVQPVPHKAWEPGGRTLRRTTCRFRVGSESSGPIFATIPFTLHRPLPEDTMVKWAHLIKRRVGVHHEWRLQFVLSRESGWEREDRATIGAAGIDIGWRMRPSGSLRVAYWIGDDEAEGEVAIDASWLGQYRKTEDIQSIRDRDLNVAKASLMEWQKRLGELEPNWFHEATVTLPSWRSAPRLASLVIRWRDNRFDGDESGFAALEAWRKRDKHLLEYEANLRDQLQRRREDQYRVFATQMRRRYRTLVLEARGEDEEKKLMDLRPFHKTPEAEEPPKDEGLKKHARDACLSALRRALVETGAVATIPAPRTTIDCALCGGECESVSDKAALLKKCSLCGHVEDQDRNAAKNLLKRWAESLTLASGRVRSK